MDGLASTNVRRAAGAFAGASVALLAVLPLLVERAIPPLEGGLALVASIAALEALIFAPLLLPVAVGLLGAEIVVSVHRGDVDTVVTEHGLAHLRGLDLDRRAEALIAIAAPQFREGLAAEWTRTRSRLA